MGGYRDLFNASIADPEAFWADAARAVTWTREPTRVLDDSNPPFYRWFPDAELKVYLTADPEVGADVFGARPMCSTGSRGRTLRPAPVVPDD